ncbi:MAG TPA: ABC transporter permease [Thermoanaerobaculia bacterium]|jgi:putative ABC transport system permease protein
MNSLLQDIRYALRRLGRSPGFTAAAALTLALGIGANTAMFSVINAVLLRPLPYPGAERLVRLWAVNPQQALTDVNLNPLDFADYRRRVKGLADLAALALPRFAITGQGEPERVPGARVSGNFFRAFGARPALGRDFQAADERPGAEAVALLSHALWQRRYGSDRGVVGRKVILDDEPVTIVGVLPAGFRAPTLSDADQPQIWLPLQIAESMGRGGHWLLAFGRLADGVTLAQAQAELDALARGLEREHPGSNQGWRTRLQDLKQAVVGDTRAPLLLLLASVGLVLLIACVNVANLQLARAATRQHEVAVRSTLGASVPRLVRQLLTESALLCALGGLGGLSLAWLAAWLMARLRPGKLPRAEEIGVDGRVLLFTLGVAVLAGLLFGLVPALRTATPQLGAGLRQGGRAAPGRRLPAALIVGELAAALVLLIGAGLLIKSFWRLLDVDPGFRPAGLLKAEVELPASRYGEPQRISAFFQELLARAAALPGVEGATAVDILPFSGGYSCNSFSVDDGSSPDAEKVPCIEYRTVGPDYFRVMGIPVLRGRSFQATDAAGGAPVALINDTLARALWPGRDPLGRRITLGFETQTPHVIVGVVRDVRHFGLQQDVAPEVYVAYPQHPASAMTVVLRASGDPMGLVGPLRTQVRSLDPQLPLGEAATMESLVTGSVGQPRLRTQLLLAFALIALALAAVGLFGVVSYSVVRRTHEIGVRMALGADRPGVLRLVLGQTLAYAAGGLLLGLLSALALTRLLAGFLFGVGALDPVIFGASSALLLAVALLASYLPARQASRLEPLTALGPVE